MNTQWRKIAGDFRQHRLQIFLIGVILVLGTAGVVAALNARAILAREIAASYQRANAPDILLWFDKVNPALLDLVRARPGVAEVDARSTAFLRIAGKSGEWFPMRLTLLPDFAKQKVNLIHRDAGSWPADNGGILIEQSGITLLDAREGDRLHVRTPAGGETTIPVSGFVHDTAVAPSTQDRMIYGYITPAAASSLGQNAELDQLLVKLKMRGSMSDVAEFADDLSAWLKARNAAPLRADALNNAHPHAALMTAMLRVLEVLAGLAFICSATLAACVISLWMRREVRQVGIMKTLGARSSQLAWQYLALVAPLVLVATGLALPLRGGNRPLGRQVSRNDAEYRHQRLERATFACLRGIVLRARHSFSRHGGADRAGRAHSACAKRFRIPASSRRAVRSVSLRGSSKCPVTGGGHLRCEIPFAGRGGSRSPCSRFRRAARCS